jgi:CheY-like chemotaxis protein
MNGLEFLKALRADPELKNSVVFMLTTSHDAEDRRLAYESNIAGYMLKPNFHDDLMKITGMLDMYWRVVELPLHNADTT